MQEPRIEPIGADRRDEQIRLFNATFHKTFTSEHWRLKHEQNPYTGQSENLGMICGEELIGFNRFLPQEYLVDGQPRLFAQSCESVVREDARGHGYLGHILSAAETALRDRYDVIYGTPNPKSQRTFQKLGYRTLCRQQHLVLPGSAANLLREGAARARKQADGPALGELDAALLQAFRGSRVLISRTCPRNMDWDFDARGGRVRLHRSEAFYRWKIDSYRPQNQQRRYLYRVDQGAVRLFCVAAFTAGRAAYHAQLLDLCVADCDPATLRELARGLRKLCFGVSIFAQPGGPFGTMLRRAGFRTWRKQLDPVVYKVINPAAGDLAELLAQPGSWQVFQIESDTILN